MSDFEEKLNTVLNDPSSMEQILKLAQQLAGNQTQEEAPKAQPEENGDMLKLMNLLKSANLNQDSRYSGLLEALKPYLKRERQEKLERAIKVSRLSRLAKLAIESGMMGEI